MAHPARLVQVVRSGLVESVHRGSVAVADAGGALVANAGDPERLAFARSTMKPLQAAVSLSLIPDELSHAEIAVMCASHNGEPVHLETVASILRRADLSFGDLRCPAVRPMDPETAAAAAGAPAPEYSDCSGKHAGMLLACVRQGWDTESYREPDHPLEQRVLDAVRAASGEEPAVGVDGCGVPVHGLPLRALATVFARLAAPDALGELGPFAKRAIAAMRAEPYQVAGRDRVCTDVMTAADGIVMKIGAEGLLCAALLQRGLGVAVKIDDGASRATAPAMLHALAALGAIGEDALQALSRWVAPSVLGGGLPVGSLVAGFDLERTT